MMEKLEAEELVGKVNSFTSANAKFIIELPPILRRGAESERRLFNSTLRTLNMNREYVVIRMAKEIEDVPKESALYDDLHLTRNNCKIMASHIESVVCRELERKQDSYA